MRKRSLMKAIRRGKRQKMISLTLGNVMFLRVAVTDVFSDGFNIFIDILSRAFMQTLLPEDTIRGVPNRSKHHHNLLRSMDNREISCGTSIISVRSIVDNTS